AVRVWVAACATGEEAYTLAILASEAFWPQRPPVSILATDISEAALELAQRGRFSERSLRNVPAELRDRSFAPAGQAYQVRAAWHPPRPTPPPPFLPRLSATRRSMRSPAATS